MSNIHRTKGKRTEFAGHSFASNLEKNLYMMLVLRQRGKEIGDIQVQDTVRLSDAEIIYKPDFKFTNLETGEDEWAEAKGIETPEWRLKRKLWQYYGPGKLHVYMAKPWSSTPVFKETIIPRSRKT